MTRKDSQASNGRYAGCVSAVFSSRQLLYTPQMPAQIIDGTALANRLKQEVAAKVQLLASHGKAVHLTALLAGSTHGGELYAQRQGEACRAVGINYQLLTFPENVSQRELKYEIRRLNNDP